MKNQKTVADCFKLTVNYSQKIPDEDNDKDYIPGQKRGRPSNVQVIENHRRSKRQRKLKNVERLLNNCEGTVVGEIDKNGEQKVSVKFLYQV